jgi:outer membrane receptor for ferrienterochelin and colicins
MVRPYRSTDLPRNARVHETAASRCHPGAARLALLPLAIALTASAAASDDARLPSVLITATGYQQEVRDAPAASTLVDRETLDRTGAENTLEAIRDTPGIGLTGRSVGGRKTVSLRGLEGKHTLFLVDGVRVIGTDDWVGHSDYQYGWVPMSAVDRIEVIRGPMSVLYGSDALGGVVNVITAQPAKEWHGSARLLARDSDDKHAGNGFSGGFSVGGGVGDAVRLSLAAEQRSQDAVALKEDPRLSEIEGSESASGQVKLSWQANTKHRFDLDHRTIDEQRDRDVLARSGTVYHDIYDIDRSQSVLTWHAAWTGQANTRLRLWQSEFSVTNARDQGQTPTRPQSMDEQAAEARMDLTAGKNHRLALGIDLRTETLQNAGLLPDGEDSADHEALYLQDEWVLADTLLFTLGVRQDHHSIFGSETSPRAYLVWHLDERLSLRGGYGEGFRAPTLKQASGNYVGAEGPHTFYGNTNIRPETSASGEIGIVFSSRDTHAEATLFHTDIDDLITTRLTSTVGPRSFYIYDNINSARIAGLEAAFTRQLAGGFRFGLNALALETEDWNTGKQLDGRPEFSANLSLGWQDERAGMELRVSHIGEQRLAGAPAPSYETLNLSASWEISKQVKLLGGIDNLTGVRLAEKSKAFSYVETPRTARIGLLASF